MCGRRRPRSRRRLKKARRSRRRGGRAPPRCGDRDLRNRRAPRRSRPIAGDIGLKPITRRVWAPRGERPIASCHHRFEWLYVTAFVSPATGESFWYLSTGVDKALFAETLALFAREAGAGQDRVIILVLDGAGWHTAPGLAVPDGIRLVYLPPYTPELQPAETLWTHVDEPIANRHFETLQDLDAAVAARCVDLNSNRNLVKSQTSFHWWPHRHAPT